MPEAIVALAAIAALGFVLAPLLGNGSRRVEIAGDPGSDADQRKHAALAAIVDLEREHAMGKLGDEDLSALRRSLEAEALQALRDAERSEAAARSGAAAGRQEEELEREIAAVRARLRCPACGTPRPAASDCPGCGAAPAPTQ